MRSRVNKESRNAQTYRMVGMLVEMINKIEGRVGRIGTRKALLGRYAVLHSGMLISTRRGEIDGG